ncbi:hypothetical protein E6C76_11425 [Pseudothauera nasutitermitis]|uniref:Uncharacterized protein n=1 Tax=Pseudothauera nasutitermitis TaxID=2565930 RepID=A0A4S4B187_9RHOO|nr:hypothetical protein [Pseudothauera nasutitermitis]THF64658.1 hypothetical protein E6C76_11425 [Pseudothauera nasutitermitis]
MQFLPRRTESYPDWLDTDGIKIYTISAHGDDVDQAPYLSRLAEVKQARNKPWGITPAFAIFHDGASARYLVLAWWGNDNELFTSVSVQTPDGWVEDPERYSFCLWDLEVIWHERNSFVRHCYCPTPDIEAYRQSRLDSA